MDPITGIYKRRKMYVVISIGRNALIRATIPKRIDICHDNVKIIQHPAGKPLIEISDHLYLPIGELPISLPYAI